MGRTPVRAPGDTKSGVPAIPHPNAVHSNMPVLLLLLLLFEYLRRCDELQSRPWACLVDAAVPGQFGGSGVTADWRQLSVPDVARTLEPLILAGGLTTENVTQAIQTVHPWGVDVASGVETSKGVKDLRRVEEFIKASRLA